MSNINEGQIIKRKLPAQTNMFYIFICFASELIFLSAFFQEVSPSSWNGVVAFIGEHEALLDV